MQSGKILVQFGTAKISSPAGYDAVLSGAELDALVGPGSIYEAAALLEELPHLRLRNGTPVAKSFLYKGYELWWIHYDSLFYHFCLPYTRYRALLERLRSYEEVHLQGAPNASLFQAYFEAYGVRMRTLSSGRLKSPSFLPFGVVLQMLLTILFVPALMVLRRPAMVYIGDKFEQGRDHDFRFRFVYEELRRKKLPFVEFVRGVQPWRITLAHAWVRRRPVVYTEAVVFFARFIAVVLGGRARARKRFGEKALPSETQGLEKFKLLLATRYVLGAYEDVWAIRIMRALMRVAGIRASLIAAGSERSFAAVLACKLAGITSIGILHGVASRFYNVYEFMPGFTGAKRLSVDRYGVWSEWWKSYFTRYSKAYAPDQLEVSGPMRPLQQVNTPVPQLYQGAPRVLFVSEEVAAPEEVLPYLRALLEEKEVVVTLKFRPTRDGFEEWLQRNCPELLQDARLHTTKGTMQEALENADVAVGCQSTGVLEALKQLRVPVFFRTGKWGDYFELKELGGSSPFFAENPAELIQKIKASRAIECETLQELQERYFGDPYKNGSAWAVGQLEELLKR